MIECEVLAGLRPFLVDEVRRLLGRQAELAGDDDPTAVRFGYAGRLEALLRLFQRCLVAAARWWSVERAVQVWQKGHHPKVYVLRRRDETGRTGD